VPASGAASRMFKDLFEFRDSCTDKNAIDFSKNEVIADFFKNIRKFAFHKDLDTLLKEQGGVDRLIVGKEYLLVLNTLLNDEGLSYGTLPKGLLKFHYYAGNIGRTPFEEHLVEGAKYAKSENGNVAIHFTVSPEHLELFEALKEKVIDKYEGLYQVKYTITYSIQKLSTDTIAVNPDNTPFYDEDGTILFRPGGHGALIENLNEIDSDIIFIKNIDNVVPEKRLERTVSIKQALAGLLVETQNKIFSFCEKLVTNATDDLLEEALHYIEHTLCISGPFFHEDAVFEEKVKEVFNRLNRPLRICGMVKNVGEPGGGPFLVKDSLGFITPQVVESSQVNDADAKQVEIFNSATHFNPVDLVCGVKDYKGNKFNLKDFVDESTCFISKKSKNGKDLKALELPGLWNGAMAGWNTIFVEVSINTFSPVKTVNDLLREAHQ
jgi:hypothetical protein